MEDVKTCWSPKCRDEAESIKEVMELINFYIVVTTLISQYTFICQQYSTETGDDLWRNETLPCVEKLNELHTSICNQCRSIAVQKTPTEKHLQYSLANLLRNRRKSLNALTFSMARPLGNQYVVPRKWQKTTQNELIGVRTELIFIQA